MISISIAKDFSDAPGGRYKNEGENSGEEFRDRILKPKFDEAKRNNEKIEIDFDNCYGFATSFLEEAFGGFVRTYKTKGLLNCLVIISNDDATLYEKVKRYITDAEGKL